MADQTAKVLVVDDDEKLCRLLKRILARAGYEVLIANSGAAMRDHLTRADVILLDLHLPDATGLSLIQEIRSGGASQGIIILSGSANLQDDRQYLDAGASECIAKPFSPEAVIDAVARTLSGASRPPQ